MKFPKRERRSGNDDHLIPLINVVFLMLIFFMVMGRIAPADLYQVRPPTSQSQQLLKENSVTLLITRDGILTVDAAPVTLETLIPVLHAALDAAGRERGATPEIRIKADAALTTGQLTPVLDRLRNSGQTKVRLLTWRNG